MLKGLTPCNFGSPTGMLLLVTIETADFILVQFRTMIQDGIMVVPSLGFDEGGGGWLVQHFQTHKTI